MYRLHGKQLLSLAAGIAVAWVLTTASWAQEARSGGLQDLERMNEALASSIDKVLPTVVNISSTKTEEIKNPFEGSPFEEWFFHQFRDREERTIKSYSLGSGIIIDGKKGYVLTNNHVVEGAEEILITYYAADGSTERFEGQAFPDPKTELALVKIKDMKGMQLPEAKLGDSDSLRVGHLVLAIGNPFQKSQSVSMGIVSGLGRQEGGPQFQRLVYKDFIQTDAAINRGNSGGPLLNIYGEVIGINTYIYSTSGGAQGVGFAVPINWAKTVIDQLVATGRVVRPYLGVGMVNVKQKSKEAIEQLGILDPRGVIVEQIYKNSPADRAGLQLADVLLEFDGEPIEDSKGLQMQVVRRDVGQDVKIRLWRPSETKEMTVKVTLGEQPEDMMVAASALSPVANERLGMKLGEMTQERARGLNAEAGQGLLVEDVEPDSPAAREGIQPNDVLLRANFEPVNSVADLDRIVGDMKEKGKTSILLEVVRKSLRFMAVLPLAE